MLIALAGFYCNVQFFNDAEVRDNSGVYINV